MVVWIRLWGSDSEETREGDMDGVYGGWISMSGESPAEDFLVYLCMHCYHSSAARWSIQPPLLPICLSGTDLRGGWSRGGEIWRNISRGRVPQVTVGFSEAVLDIARGKESQVEVIILDWHLCCFSRLVSNFWDPASSSVSTRHSMEAADQPFHSSSASGDSRIRSRALLHSRLLPLTGLKQVRATPISQTLSTHFM